MSYEDLLRETAHHLSYLKYKYKLSPSNNSWVYEAMRTIEELITVVANNLDQGAYFKKEDYLYDKTITALSELTNLSGILEPIDKVNKDSLNVFLGKLKKVFNAPMLIKDEDYNSSEGRNTMFELQLFSKLVALDFDVSLPSDQHPDILVNVDGNTYFIECKRIFKKDTFVVNVQNAIDQLEEYSFKNKSGYGIVAISVTRYFHSGDKRLEATTEAAMRRRIEVEMDKLLEENKNNLLSRFPLRIPALFLDFSDRAVADKAYCVNLVDVIETANGRPSLFYKVRKDFHKLTSQNLV